VRPPVVIAAALALLALALGACGGGSGGASGSAGDDKLAGTHGDDAIDGKAGDDVIEAQGGNDRITGGQGADFLYGGPGDDRFLADSDDAIDVHDCGPGDDFITEPDARDQLLPNCERAGWTQVGPGEFANTIEVQPAVSGRIATFGATCPQECSGTLELRTPNDRKLLGEGKFHLAAGQPGTIRGRLTVRGIDLRARGGYFRIVLRAGGVNSGFTTFVSR
jgi:hypothetical protein